MNLYVKVCLFALLIALPSCRFVSFSDDEAAPLWHLKYELPAPAETAQRPIQIFNQSGEPIPFKLVWGDRDLSSFQGILRAIDAEDPNESRPYFRAWKFVHQLSQHYAPFSVDSWYATSKLFLLSAGFGICDDRAEVLYHIWRAQGYDARLWGLYGHVVPEVFAEGRWQLLDPDFGVYYLNDQGLVASVDEIIADPSLIWNPRATLEDYLPGAYDFGLAEIYGSSEDNHNCGTRDAENECIDILSSADLEFKLPPGIGLVLPKDADRLLTYDPDVIEIPNFKVATIQIPPNRSGSMVVPLIPVRVSGSGQVEIDGGVFEVGDQLNEYLMNRRSFSPNIDFKSRADGIDFEFSLNPKVFSSSEVKTFGIVTTERVNLLVLDHETGVVTSAVEILPAE